MYGALALAVLAGFSLLIATDYELWAFGSPGSGLMPTIAAAVLLITSLFAAREKILPDPDQSDRGRLYRYGAGLLILPAAIGCLGMLPALGLFVLLMLRSAEHMRWLPAAAIAAVSIGGSWLLFDRLLRVPLPNGALW